MGRSRVRARRRVRTRLGRCWARGTNPGPSIRPLLGQRSPLKRRLRGQQQNRCAGYLGAGVTPRDLPAHPSSGLASMTKANMHPGTSGGSMPAAGNEPTGDSSTVPGGAVECEPVGASGMPRARGLPISAASGDTPSRLGSSRILPRSTGPAKLPWRAMIGTWGVVPFPPSSVSDPSVPKPPAGHVDAVPTLGA